MIDATHTEPFIHMPWGGGATPTTVSGRQTTPTPKQLDPSLPTTTGRKLLNAKKRTDEWLRDNAVAEARARGRTDLAREWEREDVSKHGFPPATHAAMFAYLFLQPELVQADERAAACRLRPLVTA